MEQQETQQVQEQFIDSGQVQLIERIGFLSNLEVNKTIILPDSNLGYATKITKKRPIIERKPIYLLDENNEKLPRLNEDGSYILNENNEIQYIIKDYLEKIIGFEAFEDKIPATEPIITDIASSNYGQQCMLTMLDFGTSYDIISSIHCIEDEKIDYSYTLAQTANVIKWLAILHKGLNGHASRIVKTNITKDYHYPIEQQKKKGFFDGIAKFFGANSDTQEVPE